MSPGLKRHLNDNGIVLSDAKVSTNNINRNHWNDGKVLVSFNKLDNQYGTYWINPKYLKYIGKINE